MNLSHSSLSAAELPCYNRAVIIDAHTHVFAPEVRDDRDAYLDDPCFAALYANPKAKIITADELVASMDAAGIAVAAILNIGWTTHERCVESNDYLLESIARYPQRLVGFAMVQPRYGEKALLEIERCAAGGISGIGELRPDIQGLDLEDNGVMTPFVSALVEHDLILLTHASEPVGHQYPGKGSVTPEALYPFIVRYPDVKIICSHWGGGLPFYALMPEVKNALKNVFFDTAASPFLYRPQVYEQVAQILGANKIIFGSDYPLLPPARLVKEIESLNLDEATKKQIFSGNAARLFKFQAREK